MPVRRGSTFILRNATGTVPHLWIVIAGPSGDPAEVLIVHLTTLRDHSDDTVVLYPGEHPFIRHPTSVRYSEARFVRVAQLEEHLSRGVAVQREEASGELVRKVADGLLRSPFTVHAVRERYVARFAEG